MIGDLRAGSRERSILVGGLAGTGETAGLLLRSTSR